MNIEAVSDVHPERETVLVVEDDVLIRLLIAESLRDSGLRVLEAVNADEAIMLLRSGLSVDLIFTDYEMPGSMNGVELIDIVRAEFSEIPCILTSGVKLVTTPGRFFIKPYAHDDVVREIWSALEGPSRD